nr:type II secretion system protein GspE [Syntrophales bacterium]
QTGYRGRVGIHELLVANDNVKRLIARKATVEDLRNAAIQEGMSTLLQDGIKKVIEGITDFEQVRRVCIK